MAGWNTTDKDEIAVRKKRALKEEFEIINLKRKNRVFSSYSVKSKNSSYLVELRSLKENINSCSCPDIAVNKLGTCKHIEAVKLLHKDKKPINKNIEIYLDTIDEKIKVIFPKSKKIEALKEQIEPFFSSSGELLFEPVVAFKSLERKLKDIEDLKGLRVSKLIDPWIKQKEFELEKEKNKEYFLQDYKDGKRSFDFLKYSLYDYQKEGVLHLAFNERALLADDMGLGKTIQAIGASVLLKKLKNIKKVLVISPASLKAEWDEQIKKFTDEKSLFIFGNKKKRDHLYTQDSFFYLTNYEQILYDYKIINSVLQPDVIILDEAQRVKNWQTKTARSIKYLKSRYAFILTGTPLENRIDEIYSIVQIIDPKIFGPLFRFNREFYKLDEQGKAIGYKNINLLHKKLQPIMLRRKKEEIEQQLPPRVDKSYFVTMDKITNDRYEEYETMVSSIAARAKKRPLSFEELQKLQIGLSCMRILCDSAYILDQKITTSPKVDEAIPIIEEILEDESNKIIIFSQWEKMLELLNKRLKEKDIQVAWHTGSYSQMQRKKEIEKFKTSSDCNIFLSTDAGSTGLNLQVANVVINLDIPWTPAKLEQRVARAWRKYQKKTVQVINFITENRLEHRIVEMVKQKQFLSDNVLDGLGNDELKLPSSSKQFIEDVQKILQSNFKPKETKVDPKQYANDIVSIVGDRIEEIKYNKNRDTIFIVADKKDKILEDKVKNTQAKNIQIIDKQQYNFLQDLASKGLISLSSDLENLYSNKQEKQKKVDTKILISVKEKFDNIKRKYKMVKLLLKGGFIDESKPAIIELSKNISDLINIFNENSISFSNFDKDFLQYISDIENNEKIKQKYFISNMKKLSKQIKILIKEL